MFVAYRVSPLKSSWTSLDRVLTVFRFIIGCGTRRFNKFLIQYQMTLQASSLRDYLVRGW
jgi:hypothetical protein